MKTKYLLLTAFLLVIVSCTNLFAQEDVQIGKSANGYNNRYNGGVYDYSDPNAINIKVMVWGYVKFPGQYIIPETSGVNQLLSQAGGPTPDANLDEMKLFRIAPNGMQTVIPFNYSDLLSGDKSLSGTVKIPDLQAGDIMLVPGAPKWYAKDYLSILISIVSALASIATLIAYSHK